MFSLMGNCFSCIKNKRQPKRTVTLAVLGLDSAGKSTTTKALLGESVDPSEQAPTIGFNNHEFTYKNYDITLYDLGGGRKIRDIWKDYLSEIYGVIYIVDSAAPERFPEVKETLENLLSHEKVREKPLLVLANKEDLTKHVDEVEIMEHIDLEKLVNTNKCYCKMVMCSAIKGTGKKMDENITVGMTWLVTLMDQIYEKLKLRVDEDVKVMEQKRQKEKEERKERVRKQKEERQRKEEEERKKLGIEDEVEDEDNDDIQTGHDPFKRLDSDEIKRKEEKYRKAKAKEKEKQQKLKEMGQSEHSKQPMTDNNMNLNVNTHDDDEDNFRAPRSSRSLLGLTWLNGGLANGHSPGRDGINSDRDGYVQRSARQLLPPLEDSPRSIGGGRDKKRAKKLKNKIGANDNAEHFNDFDTDHAIYNGQSMSSVSRIQVEAVHNEDDLPEDSVVHSSARTPFRKSKGLYMQDDTVPVHTDKGSNKKKGKKKKPQTIADDDDEFDTLRLSQHLDMDVDAFHRHSPDAKPGLSISPIEERSDTPVKKLRKKKNHLRKNKLAPSDDEFELSDVQNTPKKRAIPWVRSPSPNKGLDDEDSHTNWGMAEDLSADEMQPIRRSRPNFDGEDNPIL